MKEEFLWVEKYRPKTVKECILPASIKSIFQKFVGDKNVPNLLLAGTPGIGKTTVALALLNEIEADYIVLNGSLKVGVDVLHNDIRQFASTVSFQGGRKYVILDEADYLNPNHIQPALRNFIEQYSKNCGFILTCNYKNKIIEPLQSRLSLVDFKIDPKQAGKVASQIHSRLLTILVAENIPYDEAVVAELVKKHFPDWRKVINELQKYSSAGIIDSGILTNFAEVSITELIGFLKAKKFTEIRKWAAENSTIEPNDFFEKLYEMSKDQLTPVGQASLVLTLAKYQYQSAFVANQEINMVACLTEIMIEGGWK